VAFEGATEGVEHQARAAAAPAAAKAVDIREPRQPWKSLMVLLAMIFGVLLAGKRPRRAAGG
jgi:hypothetical protein